MTIRNVWRGLIAAAILWVAPAGATVWSADTSFTSSLLLAVSCPTSYYCKAVGVNGIIGTWNGSTWTADVNPDPTVPKRTLRDVACISPTDCVAVGNDTAILHWNGTSWGFDTTSIPATTDLFGVGARLSFYLAVGAGGTALYYDGAGTWPPTLSPTGVTEILYDYGCGGPIGVTECFAVGDGLTILKGNALVWSTVQTSPGDVGIGGVSCSASYSCKAVGPPSTIYHYDGVMGWSTKPSTTLSFLHQVSCPGDSFCRAVGAGGVIVGWDGTNWVADTSNTTAQLLGVSCPNTEYCKAVGDSGTIISFGVAENTPTPTGTETETPTVTATGTETGTATETATATATTTDTATATATATASATDTASSTATQTATHTATATGTATDTVTATATVTQTPTASATVMPTFAPFEDAAGPQACNDGFDNDDNGLIDCADPACAGVAPCTRPAPAADSRTLAVALLVLAAIGGLAMWRRRGDQR